MNFVLWKNIYNQVLLEWFSTSVDVRRKIISTKFSKYTRVSRPYNVSLITVVMNSILYSFLIITNWTRSHLRASYSSMATSFKLNSYITELYKSLYKLSELQIHSEINHWSRIWYSKFQLKYEMRENNWSCFIGYIAAWGFRNLSENYS